MKFVPRSSVGRVILAVAAVVALGVAWYLGSPLFIDREVDEEFPAVQASVTMDEAMPAASQPELIASGSFVDADAIHQGSGSAAIYRLEDGRHILRFEDFEVTNGPDLYVWLSSAAEGADSDAIKASETIELRPLKGNIGNQNYELPSDFSVDDIGSVVIWCRRFGVLFSQAAFQPV